MHTIVCQGAQENHPFFHQLHRWLQDQLQPLIVLGYPLHLSITTQSQLARQWVQACEKNDCLNILFPYPRLLYSSEDDITEADWRRQYDTALKTRLNKNHPTQTDVNRLEHYIATYFHIDVALPTMTQDAALEKQRQASRFAALACQQQGSIDCFMQTYRRIPKTAAHAHEVFFQALPQSIWDNPDARTLFLTLPDVSIWQAKYPLENQRAASRLMLAILARRTASQTDYEVAYQGIPHTAHQARWTFYSGLPSDVERTEFHVVPQDEAWWDVNNRTEQIVASQRAVAALVHAQADSELYRTTYQLIPAAAHAARWAFFQAVPKDALGQTVRSALIAVPPDRDGWRLTRLIARERWYRTLQNCVFTDAESPTRQAIYWHAPDLNHTECLPHTIKRYRVRDNIVTQIIDGHGRLRPRVAGVNSRHQMYPIVIDGQRRFWLKLYPELAGLECAITELMWRLVGGGGLVDAIMVRIPYRGNTGRLQTALALLMAHVPHAYALTQNLFKIFLGLR